MAPSAGEIEPLQPVRLGRSGLHVSPLALGTMALGSEVPDGEALLVMERALEHGMVFFDTADVYPAPRTTEPAGRTEQLIGDVIKGRRDQVVIATKCGNRMSGALNDVGGSRKHVIESCEASLRRLGTDRVDVFYLHRPDLEAPLDEALEAVDRLVQDGKVLYLGLSNFAPWQVALAMETIAGSRLSKITVLQDRYNLVHRVNERDIHPLARASGYGMLAYNPLAGGILVGRHKRGEAPPETGRFSIGIYQERYLTSQVFDVAEAVAEIAADEGLSAVQVALAWVMSKPGVIPLVGPITPEQVESNVAAASVRLPDEVLQRLDTLSDHFKFEHHEPDTAIPVGKA